MSVIRTIRSAATVAAILLLAGCILEPQDDSGSISFSVSAPEASISGSSITIDGDEVDPDTDVTHARVWMYTNGSEYRLAPTSARAPSSRNYVEADLSSGSATVKIDDIPAGGGYSAVIILGKQEEDVFIPAAYARTGRFSINAGLETEVRPQKVKLVGEDASPLDSVAYRSLGEDLNSVIVSGGEVIAADSDTVYEYGESGSPAESDGFGSINRLSTGTIGGDAVWFTNSSEGIFLNGNTPKISEDGIENVTFSGAFSVDETTDVVFYQRKGGLGGVAGATISSTSEWEDFGSEDLEDLIDPDTSPVRAQASGSDSGFFATSVLDNFRLTEALFDVDSDIEAEDLISGTVDGVNFFDVPYPGGQRMRINHMEVVNVDSDASGDPVEHLVVGTPRGAFAFPQENIGGGSDVFNSSTNVLNATHSSFRSIIRDESVAALATDAEGKWLAVATAETIVVLNVADGVPQPESRAEAEDAALFILPRRGVALGEVTGLAIQVDARGLQLHISGTQGLTTVAKDLPD